MITRRKSAFLMALLVAGAVVALSSSVFATVHVIDVANFSFLPPKTHVQPGDTVRWVWVDGTHTTTSDNSSAKSWDGSVAGIGQSFEIVFTGADGNGPFPYHCFYHGTLYNMKDTIFMTSAGVEIQGGTGLPEDFSLDQNYPNPFNPSTTIRFTLPRPADVQFTVINELGETVARNPLGRLGAGNFSVTWDGRNAEGQVLPSGVYFYRIQAGDYSETRKMVLLK
jgi:plastocyanin